MNSFFQPCRSTEELRARPPGQGGSHRGDDCPALPAPRGCPRGRGEVWDGHRGHKEKLWEGGRMGEAKGSAPWGAGGVGPGALLPGVFFGFAKFSKAWLFIQILDCLLRNPGFQTIFKSCSSKPKADCCLISQELLFSLKNKTEKKANLKILR